MIQSATDAKNIEKCFDAMHALRPHLTRETFVERITGMQQRGYHLVYIAENGTAAAACGYRFTEHLAWGKAIYIDDLTTLPTSRKKGYARMLLDYVYEEAGKNNCDELHLDSGANATRYDAHRLYLRYGFNITSHHFAMKVSA